jgi:hypothetical protein
MTTIEALIGIEAKRFSRAGRVSAAQKRVLYSDKNSDLRVDSQKGFVVPFVVRARAEKFTRENRELPNLADVE